MWSLLASSSGYQGCVPLTQASTSMAANRSSGSAKCTHNKQIQKISALANASHSTRKKSGNSKAAAATAETAATAAAAAGVSSPTPRAATCYQMARISSTLFDLPGPPSMSAVAAPCTRHAAISALPVCPCLSAPLLLALAEWALQDMPGSMRPPVSDATCVELMSTLQSPAWLVLSNVEETDYAHVTLTRV